MKITYCDICGEPITQSAIKPLGVLFDLAKAEDVCKACFERAKGIDWCQVIRAAARPRQAE